MSPEQFGEITPSEFVSMMRGFNWKDDRDKERTAWWLANVMNKMSWMCGEKGSLTPQNLIKKV